MSHRLLPFMEDVWGFLAKLFIAMVMYFSPIKSFIHLVSALIVIDFLMGIAKSLKLGEAITAKRMSKTIFKLILYSVAIIATYLVQKIAGEDGSGLVRIAALFIGATELKSIYDHISKMVGGDIFGQLWTIVKSRIDFSLNKNKPADEPAAEPFNGEDNK